MAIDDAQAKLNTLSQAQALLSTAEVSLMPLLRQELETAERDRADTWDPHVSLTDALLPRKGRFVPRGEAQSITRTPRTDTGEEGWAKLDIEADPVAFTAGKRAAAGLVATDELPLRSVTLRATGTHPIRIQGDDGTPTTYGNTDGVLESSLRLSGGGVTRPV